MAAHKKATASSGSMMIHVIVFRAAIGLVCPPPLSRVRRGMKNQLNVR